MTTHFAFIGLGAMGYGMASNVRQKLPSSSKLFIHDVYHPACEKFISENEISGPTEIVQSAKEAAEKANVVISCLPSTETLRAVYLNKDSGVLAASSNPERLILECSTIDITSACEVAEEIAAAKSGIYIDTPMSGGAPAAAAGKLSFMIGRGKPDSSDPVGLQIEKCIMMMANPSKVFWCGKQGTGLAAKISNNYISCSVLCLIAEAMAIGVRNGVDKKVLQELVHNSSGQTFMGDIVNNTPKSLLFGRSGFPVNIMVKDIALGVDAGKQTGVNPRMAEKALEIWKEAQEDMDVIYNDGIFTSNS